MSHALYDLSLFLEMQGYEVDNYHWTTREIKDARYFQDKRTQIEKYDTTNIISVTKEYDKYSQLFIIDTGYYDRSILDKYFNEKRGDTRYNLFAVEYSCTYDYSRELISKMMNNILSEETLQFYPLAQIKEWLNNYGVFEIEIIKDNDLVIGYIFPLESGSVATIRIEDVRTLCSIELQEFIYDLHHQDKFLRRKSSISPTWNLDKMPRAMSDAAVKNRWAEITARRTMQSEAKKRWIGKRNEYFEKLNNNGKN